MVPYQVKEEWRSVLTQCGAKFVMLGGEQRMQELFADSLDTLQRVNNNIWMVVSYIDYKMYNGNLLLYIEY